jgi:hypothetical protein
LSRNAIEKIPADSAPAATGVSLTAQAWPRSLERKTRADLAPPVANQTSFSPRVTRQVPLAAKAPSPGKAGGRAFAARGFQLAPPSAVTISWNCPFTGSPRAMPFFSSQKAMASKKAAGSALLNCITHDLPPSVVL